MGLNLFQNKLFSGKYEVSTLSLSSTFRSVHLFICLVCVCMSVRVHVCVRCAYGYVCVCVIYVHMGMWVHAYLSVHMEARGECLVSSSVLSVTSF